MRGSLLQYRKAMACDKSEEIHYEDETKTKDMQRYKNLNM
jgi:hypothetical protein